MTCEEIREELVAYQDGELEERDRKQVAAHLSTCSTCTQEATSLARMGVMFTHLERVMPSPTFAKNFWQRLAQEQQPHRENRFVQWWQELREVFTNWHLTPAFVGVTSILIFFAALAQRPEPPVPTLTPKPPAMEREKTVPSPTASVPNEVKEKNDLFVDYNIIVDLDKFARFAEIAAVDLSTEQTTDVAEAELPKEVLDDLGLFTNYQILQQMERLKDFDAVLALPDYSNDAEIRG